MTSINEIGYFAMLSHNQDNHKICTFINVNFLDSPPLEDEVYCLLNQSSYIVRRPENFAKSLPYICLYVLYTKKVDISQNFVAFLEYTNVNNEL